MSDYSLEQIAKFFNGIAPWRIAYKFARLNYLGVKNDDKVILLSARIYLEIKSDIKPKPIFKAKNIQAGQWDIPEKLGSIEEVLKALLSSEGLFVEGHGLLILARNQDSDISAATPILLHQEGIASGNRLAVLSISGAQRHEYLQQPETDWMLKAGSAPFDSLDELTLDYGLGTSKRDFALLEVVATTAIQILAGSEVKDKTAKIGIWMAAELHKSKVHIGYRVVEKGKVVLRKIISGNRLTWSIDGKVAVGSAEIKVPVGSLIQCFACYKELAHHTQWLADPSIFQNPRSSVLSTVDPTGQLLRNYLLPELPPKGKVADDFEAAICWVLWALGFASANFGLNNKTRECFDTVAVSPRGDFLVIECTLGLLRAESKLSKLAARAASLRDLLNKSNMTHLRILPVIITAMTLEQIKADITQAEETGILVLTKENLEQVSNELLRLPNADNLFDQWVQQVAENSKKSGDLFPQVH